MLCVTRKRLAAGDDGEAPVARARCAIASLDVVVAGVQSRADRRRAKIQFEQLRRRLFDVVCAARDARGVPAELLAQRHRHRILQVRAADFQHVGEGRGLGVQRRRERRARTRRAAVADRSASRVAVGYTSLVDCAMLT